MKIFRKTRDPRREKTHVLKGGEGSAKDENNNNLNFKLDGELPFMDLIVRKFN